VDEVERFREQLEGRIASVAAGLPRGIVHEDAHAGNLLVDADDRLMALLDFDDARPTFLVAEVASLAVWWGVGSRNRRIVPAWAAAAVAAYARHRPLTEEEWEVLPDFMAQYDLLSATAYVAWRVRTGMPPEQAVAWCSSYGRFQELTARDDWRAALRGAIRPRRS
jgi:Ser/Thr protein kinase RdoA (MazF antagonist)